MKEGSQGYLPVGKPSTWAYFDPILKSLQLIGTKPALKDCQPQPIALLVLPTSTSINLIPTKSEAHQTGDSSEASMSNDPGVQPCFETAPSIHAVYEEEERLDWGTDDDKSHAVPMMICPKSRPVHNVTSTSLAVPASLQSPESQSKYAVTNSFENGVAAQKQQEVGCSAEDMTPALDSSTHGVQDDFEMGSESAVFIGKFPVYIVNSHGLIDV